MNARRVLCAPFPHPLLAVDSRGADENTLPITGDGGSLSVLERWTGPRARRGIRYEVASILTVVAAAALAGQLPVGRRLGTYLPQDALARLGARWLGSKRVRKLQ